MKLGEAVYKSQQKNQPKDDKNNKVQKINAMIKKMLLTLTLKT